MKVIIATLVFCIVLFLYLHVFFHMKTSDDLEIYEIEQPSKNKLEEICDLRQPVIFDFNNERLNEMCNIQYVNNNYGAFDVKVRNLRNIDDESELYIPITLKAALELFKHDEERKYITEKNQEFLEETGLIKCYRYNDIFLRPYMVSSCEYDLVTSSKLTTTPFKYDINYRNYYMVTQGNVKVKMAPPKSKKYLYQINDYENFEFKSPINPWNVQNEYKPDFDKIKCLELDLVPGKMLFIPAFWWYSFEFNENTSLCSFKYKTYMNTFSNAPLFIMRFLQSQNVKRNVAKKLDTEHNTQINESTPQMSSNEPLNSIKSSDL